jgi:hypothetical protein
VFLRDSLSRYQVEIEEKNKSVIKIKLRRIETYFYIPEFISCKSVRKGKSAKIEMRSASISLVLFSNTMECIEANYYRLGVQEFSTYFHILGQLERIRKIPLILP